MPFTQTGPVRIYYESHGEGPAVVFLHGAGGNHAAWWQQVAFFRNAYRVITVDLRGFGKSGNVADGPDSLDFPGDVGSVLDHAGVTQVTLVGQSIGAVAALRFAISRPTAVKAVVLAHSLGGINDPQLSPLVAADRAQAEKIAVLDRLLTRQFQTQQPARTFLFQQLGTFNEATMRDLRNLNVAGPTIEAVMQLGLQIYFLAGDQDVVLRPATIRAAHERLPGSTLTVVPGAPHSMYWETPDLFNLSVQQFLKQIYGAP
jgi:pimeloyl-ACP methyl ester carboxylesterase